jgi:hypothetical protein
MARNKRKPLRQRKGEHAKYFPLRLGWRGMALYTLSRTGCLWHRLFKAEEYATTFRPVCQHLIQKNQGDRLLQIN